MFSDLIYECRREVFESLNESAIKNLLNNPDVHIAGVAYHKAAAAKATDPEIKKRHMAQIKHHSKEAERLRKGDKGEGAGDADLHTRSAEMLGRKGRPKPGMEEYGSKGRGGVGAY